MQLILQPCSSSSFIAIYAAKEEKKLILWSSGFDISINK